DRRRFAGAVRPDEAHDLARVEREIDVPQREEAVALAYALELDQCVAHFAVSPCRSTISRSRSARSCVFIPSSRAIAAAASRCSSSSRRRRSRPSSRLLATNVPRPWRVTSTPSRSSSRKARFTVITLTFVAAASARIDGISWPGCQSPTAIRRRICSMSWRYIGLGSAWDMVSILCISRYTVCTERPACASGGDLLGNLLYPAPARRRRRAREGRAAIADPQ